MGDKKMPDDERSNAEAVYTMTCFEYNASPVGSRDWDLFWRGWQRSREQRAALVPAAGQPLAWMHRCPSGETVSEYKHGVEHLLPTWGGELIPLYAAAPEPEKAQGDAKPSVEDMYCAIDHFWRWVERAKWDKKIGMEPAINVLIHNPLAPWNVDRAAWDTRHKEYDEQIDADLAAYASLKSAPPAVSQADAGVELDRAIMLMDTAAQYLINCGDVEHTIFYDEAHCDGLCLCDDLRAEADNLRNPRASLSAGQATELDRLREANKELVEALEGVVRVADRKTAEFDAAHAALAKHKGGAE